MQEPPIIHPALERRASSEAADNLLDVVVELYQDPSQEATADAMRESFRQAKKAVADTIAALGGRVVDEAWINSTLRVRVPASALKQLSDLDTVRALDVPHDLIPDR